MTLKITILAENTAAQCLHAEWGFCAWIEFGKQRILYDTGLTGTCALRNARYFGIDLTPCDAIVLSHGHFDHCDGLEAVLNHLGGCTVYAHPTLFDAKYSAANGKRRYAGCRFRQEYLETKCGATFDFHPDFFEIRDSIHMTGEVPMTNDVETIPAAFVVADGSGGFVPDSFKDDNSMVIDTSQGLIVLLGCAHRGIVNIMDYARASLGKRIRAVIGGTHLFGATQRQFDFVADALERADIDVIAPGHCTGPNRIFDLKMRFPDRVDPAFCGTQFAFQL